MMFSGNGANSGFMILEAHELAKHRFMWHKTRHFSELSMKGDAGQVGRLTLSTELAKIGQLAGNPH